MKRVFVVGTPRSGTTLFLSFLSAHPLIKSFPESHFFAKLLPHRKQRLTRPWRQVSPKIIPCFQTFLKHCGRPDLLRLAPKTLFSAQRWCDAFDRSLCEMCNNEEVWVEKTPRHLHYLSSIQKLLRPDLIIHVVRDGPATVASLLAVTRDFPDQWSGERDLVTCTDRWLSDLAITLSYQTDERHLIVKYSELVSNPQHTLDHVFGRLKLPKIVASRATERLATDGEAWKAGVKGALVDSGRQRFHQLPKSSQEQILSRLGAAAEGWR